MAPHYSTTPGEFPFPFHFSYHDKNPTTSVSGANSHIFQPPPPRTPSVSSSLRVPRSAAELPMSTSDYINLSGAGTGRKRSRRDYNDGRGTPDEQRTPGSPMPFVNTRYVIKGGMDTPTLAAAELHESAGNYSDIGCRRELSGTDSLLGQEPEGYHSFLPLDLYEESSPMSRRNSQEFGGSPGNGWSKTALEVVGGVVGKVWEFCKKGAFRGFHAGGGRSYVVKNSAESSHYTFEEAGDGYYVEEKITTAWDTDRELTPLPGQFPHEDFIPNYMDNPTPTATPERPSKRRQVSSNNDDDLRKNWVVVPVANSPSKPAQQVRETARYSIATTASTARRSVATRPASRATGAGPRKPMLQRVSHAGSPAMNNLQGASYASPRSPGGKIPRATGTLTPTSPTKKPASFTSSAHRDSTVGSPVVVEAQRWAKAKMREEREADVTIRRLDAQMKAMIREAKEALGTKIEVEMEEDDNDQQQHHHHQRHPPATRPRAIKKWGV